MRKLNSNDIFSTVLKCFSFSMIFSQVRTCSIRVYMVYASAWNLEKYFLVRKLISDITKPSFYEKCGISSVKWKMVSGFNIGIILQGRRGHIDFYVRVIRVIFSPEWQYCFYGPNAKHEGCKINIVTRGLILPKSRGQRSQYAWVGPAVLTLLFGDRNFDKKNRENE